MRGARRGLQDQARVIIRATDTALMRSPVGMAAQLRRRSLVWGAAHAKHTSSPVQAPGSGMGGGHSAGVVASDVQGVACRGGHALALAANPGMFVGMDMTQGGGATWGNAQSKVAASAKLGLARSRHGGHESAMPLSSRGAGPMLAAGILVHASPLVHHMMLLQNRRVRLLSGKSAPEEGKKAADAGPADAVAKVAASSKLTLGKLPEKQLSIRERAGNLWATIKHEAHHYWLGTKLLGQEIVICYGLIRQVLKGEELTRREYRQLRTTASDVLKMVPMMIILIIPFMEAALPAILYMFPGLLPSTFQQEWKREDDMKRTLKARIEVARFLQDAVDQMAGDIKKKAASDTGHDSADEFVAFMKRVQRGDARVTNEEILKFSTLFNDDITLDNIGRPTMVNLCRLLDIPVFGSDAILKYQLLQRMRAIRTDDRMIEAEGIEALDLRELREALAYRGMRSVGLTRTRYKKDLDAWLDLSLNKNMPTTLLLMSRAFKITQAISDEDSVSAIKDTLQSMPVEAMKSAEAQATQKDKVLEAQKKMEQLQREQQFIEEERRERLEHIHSKVRGAAAAFLETAAVAWLRSHTPQTPQLSSGAEAGLKTGLDASAEADGKALKDREVDTEATLEMMLARFDALEGELVAVLRTALQPSFTKTDLKDKVHLAVLKEEVRLRREYLVAALLRPAPPPEIQAPVEPVAIASGTVEVGSLPSSLKEASAGGTRGEATEAVLVEATVNGSNGSTAAGNGSNGRQDVEQAVLAEAEEEEEVETAESEANKGELSSKVLAQIAEVIILLSNKGSATEEERETLQEIRDHTLETKKTLEGCVPAAKKDATAKAMGRLGARVDKMLKSLDGDIAKADAEIGNAFYMIDKDGDGIITVEELRQAIKVVLRKKLSPSEFQTVLRVFDVDMDGKIDIHDVEIMAESFARARELVTDEDSSKELKKPEQLGSFENLTDEQVTLWGSIFEEYRDKIREEKEILTMEKRMVQERTLKTKAEIAKAKLEVNTHRELFDQACSADGAKADADKKDASKDA